MLVSKFAVKGCRLESSLHNQLGPVFFPGFSYAKIRNLFIKAVDSLDNLSIAREAFTNHSSVEKIDDEYVTKKQTFIKTYSKNP